MNEHIDRRRALQLGAGAGAIALAGCLGGDDENGNESNGNESNGNESNGEENGNESNGESVFSGDPPEYARYLSSEGSSGGEGAAQEGTLVLMYLDFDVLEPIEELGVLEVGQGEQASGEFVGDDLADSPLGVVPNSSFVSRGLSLTGLGGLLGESEIDDQQEGEFESQVESQVLANGAVVLRGDIDTEEAGDLLVNPPERDGGSNLPSLLSFESVETVGSHEIYRGPEAPGGNTTGGDTEPPVAAVSGDDIIYATTRAVVDETVETIQGERERATEAYEEFGQALGPVADSQLMFGSYNPNGFEPQGSGEDGGGPFAGIDDVFNGSFSGGSLDEDGMDAVTTVVAADSLSDEARSTFRTELGGQTSELDIQISGREVLATGRYPNEVLESGGQSENESESGG